MAKGRGAGPVGRTCKTCERHFDDRAKHFYYYAKKDWWQLECKGCTNARSKRRFEAKKSEVLAQNKARYEANRDAVLARQKAYREANAEVIQQSRRERYYADHEEELRKRAEYRAENAERIRDADRTWRERNRERKREHDAADYRRHRARRKAAARHHYRQNPDVYKANARNYKARRRSAPGSHTAADVRAQYARQRGRCYWCECDVSGGYHVDHVIPLSKGGDNGPGNLVVACAGCNLSKGDKMPEEFAGVLL